MDWILSLASAAIGYLLGSIPTGYLIGQAHRIDIRRFGSGRTGGTNVLRTLGWLPALFTALVDILKGAAAVWAAQAIGAPATGHAAAAFCAVLGHNYTFTLKFKGGAGVATMTGATALLAPQTLAFALPVGAMVMVASRFASLGSLTLAVLIPIGIGVQWSQGSLPLAYLAASLAVSAVVIWAHRPNIRRLLQRTERKIGQRVSLDSLRGASAQNEKKPPEGGSLSGA